MSAKPKIERVDIDSLTPYEKNPRKGDVEAIRESLRVNGQYRPLIVRREGDVILAGNHTWLAAKEEGFAQVDIVRVDADEDQARRIVLADNRVSDSASYDSVALLDLLNDASAADDLLGTGYTADDLAKLAEGERLTGAGGTQLPPAVAPPGTYTEQYGVIVICEDAAEQERIYERLTKDGLTCRVVTT